MQMLGHPPESYEAIVGQNVTLMRDGKVIELSKRTGTMVEVRELIDAVGADVARFAFLLQSIDTRQTIDIDLLPSRPMRTRSSTCSTRTPALRRSPGGLHRMVLLRCRRPAPTSHRSPASERRRCCGRSKCCRRVGACAAGTRPAQGDDLGARPGRRLPRLLPRLPRSCEAMSRLRCVDARLCLTEGTRIGLAIGLDLLGVDAPEAM